MKYKIISWVRDSKGKVVKRPLKDISNAITSKCGGGYSEDDGMANTTPYVFVNYEDIELDKNRESQRGQTQDRH